MPVAVITGASSGIGRAAAIRFAEAGYAVVVHGHRNLAGLQQTAERVMAIGSQARCITANIACPRACSNLVQAAFAWQGSVAAWINNAGADLVTGSLAEAPFEQRLQALLEVDVAGSIRLGRLVAERMRNQASEDAPSLIHIGWDQAELGMEGEAGQLFCPAKAAVAAFSRALSLSYPEVRINCVAPGWIKTAWGDAKAGEYWDRRARAESLAGRWGSPQDIAEALVWLASPQAAFVGGQQLAINGGRRFYPDPPRP